VQNAVGSVKSDDAAVQAYYNANTSKYTLNCVSHILVKDKATADKLRAQIVAGGAGNDFATIARANSTDTQSAVNGGDLGCQPPGTYVTEFETAVASLAVGQLSQPVQSQFGWHLIKVTNRKPQALADVKSQIVTQLQSQNQTQMSQFIQDAVAKAKISVNPRYGVFNKSGTNPGIVPPTPPTTGTSGGSPSTSASPGQPSPSQPSASTPDTSGQGQGSTGSTQVPTSAP
jgi:hypothetical protein